MNLKDVFAGNTGYFEVEKAEFVQSLFMPGKASALAH